MCRTMKELQTISERIYELEQKKAKKKKEMDALEKEIKELKSETSSYMKKRQKNELTVAGLTVLFTACIDFYMGFVSGVTNKPNQKSMTFVSLGKS